MTLNYLVLLTPEFILAGLALFFLLAEGKSNRPHPVFVYGAMGGLILAGLYLLPLIFGKPLLFTQSLGIATTSVNGTLIQHEPILGFHSVDSMSVFFKLAILMASFLVLWMSLDYYEFSTVPMGTYSALILLATVGMMLLIGATDFLIAVIALELISIPSFILTGFIVGRRSSSEAAIKFFLVGTFSTGILLYGISYYYGYFGSTGIEHLLFYPLTGGVPDMPLMLILIFLVAGLGFKLAMVPFHMWAPDAYEGAPTPVTAFLSVAPKAAAIAFLLRILAHHQALHMTGVLAVLAAVTMTVGNIGALHQTNVKRLLAYSSIAQVGYILVALVAGGSFGWQATMVYTFLYVFMNLGVFAILIMVSNSTKNDDIPVFAGLSKKSFGLSLVLILFLLSLTGIPPLAGFVGKFTIFAAVINVPHLLWLGVVAVLNSVVSLYYYFKIAQQAFFKEADENSPIVMSPALLGCMTVALVVTVGVGILPGPLLGWVRYIFGA